MNFYNFVFVILVGFSSSAFAGSNLDTPEIKTGNNPRGCHDRMAVDIYLRCMERIGSLPLRVSDGSNFNRLQIIKLRTHPEIGASNCGQYIEVDAFNTCLNNLIRETKTIRTGEIHEQLPPSEISGSTDVAT